MGIVFVRGMARAGASARDVALAAGVGACIAAYTLVDREGVRHAAPVPYLWLVLVGPAAVYSGVMPRGGRGGGRHPPTPVALSAATGVRSPHDAGPCPPRSRALAARRATPARAPARRRRHDRRPAAAPRRQPPRARPRLAVCAARRRGQPRAARSAAARRRRGVAPQSRGRRGRSDQRRSQMAVEALTAHRMVLVDTFTDGVLRPDEPMLGPVEGGGDLRVKTAPGRLGAAIAPPPPRGHAGGP